MGKKKVTKIPLFRFQHETSHVSYIKRVISSLGVTIIYSYMKMSIFKDFGYFGYLFSHYILCPFPAQPSYLIFNRDNDVFRKIIKSIFDFSLNQKYILGFLFAIAMCIELIAIKRTNGSSNKVPNGRRTP